MTARQAGLIMHGSLLSSTHCVLDVVEGKQGRTRCDPVWSTIVICSVIVNLLRDQPLHALPATLITSHQVSHFCMLNALNQSAILVTAYGSSEAPGHCGTTDGSIEGL